MSRTPDRNREYMRNYMRNYRQTQRGHDADEQARLKHYLRKAEALGYTIIPPTNTDSTLTEVHA